MNKYTQYRKSDGSLMPGIVSSSYIPRDNDTFGHLEGEFDHLSQRVDLDKLVGQKEAHTEAHKQRVGLAWAAHDANSALDKTPFCEPRQPAFMPTSDVLVDWQAPQPSRNHEWSADTKRWQLNAAAQKRNADQAAARARISELERDVQPGLLRAVALGQDGAKERLVALDAEIAELRKAANG
jgi:hypothetical protein